MQTYKLNYYFTGLTTGCGPASHSGSGPTTPGSGAPGSAPPPSNNPLDGLDNTNLDGLDNLMSETTNTDALEVRIHYLCKKSEIANVILLRIIYDLYLQDTYSLLACFVQLQLLGDNIGDPNDLLSYLCPSDVGGAANTSGSANSTSDDILSTLNLFDTVT